MPLKIIAGVLASSSLVLALLLGTGPAVQGQTAAKSKAAAKGKIDINKATAEELEKHLPGVGAVTAKKIVAGRPFTTVDDLAKAGVPARTIDGIRDLVTVGPARASGAEKSAKGKTAAPAHSGAPVNINTATAEELETLPNVGPVHAKEIIANRPFKSVDDLARVKGLGKAHIETLRPLVTAEAPAPAAAKGSSAKSKTTAKTEPGKKVNINKASKEELDTLTGIGPVKAQAIIDARPFKTVEDIKKVKGIKEGEFEKIKNLIVVE